MSLLRHYLLMLTSEHVWIQVWFEVSAHSGRIHFHTAEDGSQPVGLSVPIEMLQSAELAPTLTDFLSIVQHR